MGSKQKAHRPSKWRFEEELTDPDTGVIYKDTDFIAIDKPIGWTVNPGPFGLQHAKPWGCARTLQQADHG